MEIKILPTIFTGGDSWKSRCESVILVKNEEDKEKIFELLVEQNYYWVSYKSLIKIAPKEISSIKDIMKLCNYCGKTDIYEYTELKSKVDFISYQYYE